MPDITVVVTARDRPEWLRRCLTALAELHTRPAVVVVDHSSQDKTARMVSRDFPQVRLLRRQPTNIPEARNAGVAASATPFVALAEVDSGWAEGALEKGVELMREYDRLAVIAARTLTGKQRKPDPITKSMAGASEGKETDLPGPSIQVFRASSAILRREAFLEVGGFDPAASPTGPTRRLVLDLERAGWGLAYVPDVVAFAERPQHPARRPKEVVLRRKYEVKRGSVEKPRSL
ncbi:MAG TPA: glycosyltransferase [Rugosimonospora sp.]